MGVDEGLLRAYLDGELAPPEREQVERWLSGLPEAQARLEQLRQTREQVHQALAVLMPATPSSAVMALKRPQAQPEPVSSQNGVPTKNPSSAVWESPSLLAELKTDVKNMRYTWRKTVTKGFIFAFVVSLVIVISAAALAVWPNLGYRVTEELQQVAPSEGVNLPVAEANKIETTTVVVALQSINRGSEVVPGSIGHRSWPARNLPAGFVATEAEALGKIARTDIAAGQVIVRGMLIDPAAPDMPDLPAGVVPVSTVFNHEIELVGYKLESKEAIDLTLYWRSVQEVANDYTVFIHLTDANGLLLAQEDSSPTQGKFPTSRWSPGQLIEDEHHTLTTKNLPAGKYDLKMGLYNSATGERLSVQSEDNPTSDSSVRLTELKIGETEAATYELKDVRKLTPCENRGRSHLFIKVQDASGQGINGIPVKIQWSSAADGFVIAETETKENLKRILEPGHIDFAMFNGTYTVEIQGAVSQIASGLTPNHGAAEPCSQGGPGNLPYHESFEVIFQQAAAVVPVASFGYGIQADPNGDAELNIPAIQELGFEWVKFQMPWKIVEPMAGSYDWTTWDQVIDAYAAKNIKVMLNIVKAPNWARPADDDRNVEGPASDPAQYASFVAKVAQRYQGKVQAIEVWNEQNLWYEAGGKGRMNAAQYVQLLQQAYPAIKAVNPEMLVISGGLTPAGNVEDLAIDDMEYLNQMYANGVKGYFDALGAHPAGNNCPALANWRTVTAAEAGAASFLEPFTTRHHSWCFLGTLEAYREVMVANGDGDKAVAITEFGWAVGDSPQPGYTFALDNTPVERAKWLVEAYQWGKKQGWVGPMILWNLDYSLTTPVTELGYFSIYYTSAYDALVKMPK